MKKILLSVLVILLSSAAFATEEPFQDEKIIISNVWARPTYGKGKMTAIYMDIQNKGPIDYLIDSHTKIAKESQIHKTVTEQGVSQMVHINRVAIPHDSVVSFKPKGLHIMLMDLHEPLKVGEKFDLVLKFKHAGVEVIEVPVQTAKSNGY